MNGRPALVACDLDGTLLDDSGAVAPGVVEAIGELRSAGVLVVICTGRTVAATRAAAARLGLESGPAISYHGAVVVDLADGRWLRRLDLPRGAAWRRSWARCTAPAPTLTAYVDDERWVQGGPACVGGAGAASAATAEARVHADLRPRSGAARHASRRRGRRRLAVAPSPARVTPWPIARRSGRPRVAVSPRPAAASRSTTRRRQAHRAGRALRPSGFAGERRRGLRRRRRRRPHAPLGRSGRRRRRAATPTRSRRPTS